MLTLLIGTILLSFFHALIPSHWLPVIAIGKQEQWSDRYVLWVTFLTGTTHVLSTVLLGGLLALLGHSLSEEAQWLAQLTAPLVLCALGGVYIYRHYYHHHFHLTRAYSTVGMVASLALAMFLSPCLEIEGFFLAAGPFGWPFVGLLALTYGLLTIA